MANVQIEKEDKHFDGDELRLVLDGDVLKGRIEVGEIYKEFSVFLNAPILKQVFRIPLN